MDIYERIILMIIGILFIIVSYSIGLNQNIKEKEYYKNQCEYYKNQYYKLKMNSLNSNKN